MPQDEGLYRERQFEHRHTEERPWETAKERGLRRNSPCRHLEFWTSSLQNGDHAFLWLKPCNLWDFVVEALTCEHSGLPHIQMRRSWSEKGNGTCLMGTVGRGFLPNAIGVAEGLIWGAAESTQRDGDHILKYVF